MNFFQQQQLLLSFFLIFLGVPVLAQDTEATRLLKEQNKYIEKEIIQISDKVYTAVGFDVSNITMVIGKDSLLIIDTGMIPRLVKEVWAEFRKITNKPVKAIIFTHGHGDHTRGASVFKGEDDVQIWARGNYGHETQVAAHAGLVNRKRPFSQGGFLLPPELRINNGIAIAVYPTPDGKPMKPPKAGAAGPARTNFDAGIVPTHTFEGSSKKLEIDGVKVELYAAPGETDDQLYVWLPEEKVLCSGDNFYRSWPNLYAIRGTAYRDVQAWVQSLSSMIEKDADAVIPGHTRPFVGKEEVKSALTNYRDAVQFVFDKTVEGIGKGLGPDDLVEYVQLPERFAKLDYLREYYGRIDHSVRSIHNGYLGWFDGNATSLVPLPPKEEALRMAQLVGGTSKLIKKAAKALKQKDYQWTAQLCDYAIRLAPANPKPKLLKAAALTALGMNTHTAITRNYYLTSAMLLRISARAE
ncbi:MAG: alkyl/aryl-sulfatase [Bacteroidota bacterium]